MELKVDIKKELLQSVVATALEIGSTEWYVMNPEDIDIVKKSHHPDVRESMSVAEMIANAVVNKNFSMPLYSYEDEEELLGGLSISAVKHGVLMMSKKEPESLIRLLNEEFDVDLADAIIQYSILGIKLVKQSA